jgi:hypothetical protein
LRRQQVPGRSRKAIRLTSTNEPLTLELTVIGCERIGEFIDHGISSIQPHLYRTLACLLIKLWIAVRDRPSPSP